MHSKTMKMKTYITLITSFFIINVFGQTGVLIGTKVSGVPENSAELEIYSDTKGVLLPRVTDTTVIVKPLAPGLLVYNMNTNSYNYYDGAGWIELPMSKHSEIHDIDNDTRMTVEKTSDVDNIQFENAGTPTMQIDQKGLNLANGSSYYTNNAKVLSLQGQSVYVGEGAGVASSGDNSKVLIGKSAGTAISTGSNLVVAGANAGVANNFSNGVVLGANAGAVNSGNNNTFIGANAGVLNSTGSSNLFVGTNAGLNNSTGSNNTFIGQNAGAGSQTGNRNIVIGAGTVLTATASDSIKIGKLISIDVATKKLTFNNEYTFPATAGTSGHTLVIDADGKTLKWEDAGVSPVDQTVLGSAASMYTFDFGARSNATTDMQRQMFMIPVKPYANTTLTKTMTWLKESAGDNGEVQMAIYDKNKILLRETYTISFNVTAAEKAKFVTMDLATPLAVIKGETYYIAVRAWNLTTVIDEGTDFAISAKTGDYIYIDTDGAPGNNSGWSDLYSFPPDLNDLSAWHAGFSAYDYINKPLPWVRAF